VSTRRGGWLAAIGIILIAVNLRPAVVALGPVLEQIRADYLLTPTLAGVLTTIPVLCFGVFSPMTARLVARFGMERTLLGVLVLLAAGIGVRLVPAVPAVFAGTFIAGVAIAVGNVVVPALIKRDFADRIGLLTGLYSTAVSAGSALAAAFTLPLQEATGWSWRGSIASWGLLAVLAAAVWAPQLSGTSAPDGVDLDTHPNPWRDRLAWVIALAFGLQSLGFYATQAWLPDMFLARGYSPIAAGYMLALTNLVGVFASFITPILAARSQTLGGLTIGFLSSAGWLTLLFSDADYLAVVLLGLAQGAGIAFVLLLIGVRSPDTAHAAELSSMSQGAGYVIAATGPFLVGALFDCTGGFTAAYWALVAVGVVLAAVAYVGGRPGYWGKVSGSVPGLAASRR
jgi:CP family cyanate transporter-like MFS transporter